LLEKTRPSHASETFVAVLGAFAVFGALAARGALASSCDFGALATWWRAGALSAFCEPGSSAKALATPRAKSTTMSATW
jgi:hypothetical protein